MGNEYHTACCGLSGIIWKILLVEGKDAPSPRLRPPKYPGAEKTVALLMEMCEPIVAKGMVVILESGFCVLEGLVALRRMGVYASAVIKKRKYWPKHVPSDAMDEYMNNPGHNKKVGDMATLKGVLDGIPYNLFCIKDVDYNMKLMLTYGALVSAPSAPDKQRTMPDGTKVSIKYTMPVKNHYLYRHAVDDHNNLHQSDISVEQTWTTQTWENRVFAFVLGITEVNVYLAMRYFVWRCGSKVPMTFLEFRRMLAEALIYNSHIVEEDNEATPERRSKRQRQQQQHRLETAPPNAHHFDGARWVCTAQQHHQKYVCKGAGCQRRIRTSCSCNKGWWLCYECYAEHRIECALAVCSDETD
jgi:hypothetical protein